MCFEKWKETVHDIDNYKNGVGIYVTLCDKDINNGTAAASSELYNEGNLIFFIMSDFTTSAHKESKAIAT